MRNRKRNACLLQIRLAIVAGALCVAAQTVHAQPIPKLNSYPTAKATAYIDFDGQVVSGTSWNWDSTIHARKAGLSSAEMTEVFNRVSEDYRIFNINITTDPNVYAKAPPDKRMRVIVTPTYEWYGAAGGVAFVNSFVWGDETPAWVFSTMLNMNAKYIGEAVAHELGHTLGLQHQSTYNKSCDLTSEYAQGKGEGEISWAPIMGTGYYKNLTTWTYGANSDGCKSMQNDIAIISKGVSNIGLRNDDYGNVRNSATPLLVTDSKFQVAGLINSSTDKDFFKITVSKKSRLLVLAAPYNIAEGNSGANVDLLMTLIKSTGDTILAANPKTLLSASIDTFLLPGTYFIALDGVSNQNVSDYGSVGNYTVSGTLTTLVTPQAKPVLIKGNIKENLHLFDWNSAELRPIGKAYLEYSTNGINFVEMTPLSPNTGSYSYTPLLNGRLYYRLRYLLSDKVYTYSNTVVLESKGILVGSNIISNQVQLNVEGDYQYQLFDETGRLYQRGKVTRGINTVPVNQVRKGLLLMKVFNEKQQFTFKLIKQ